MDVTFEEVKRCGKGMRFQGSSNVGISSDLESLISALAASLLVISAFVILKMVLFIISRILDLIKTEPEW